MNTYFASCAPGVEPILFREVKELGFKKAEQQVGGVRFSGDLTTKAEATRKRFVIRLVKKWKRARPKVPIWNC